MVSTSTDFCPFEMPTTFAGSSSPRTGYLRDLEELRIFPVCGKFTTGTEPVRSWIDVGRDFFTSQVLEYAGLALVWTLVGDCDLAIWCLGEMLDQCPTTKALTYVQNGQLLSL